MKNPTNQWLKNNLQARYKQLQKLDSNDPLVKETIDGIKSTFKTFSEIYRPITPQEYLKSSYDFIIPYSFLFSHLEQLANIPNDTYLSTSLNPTLNLKQEDLLELVHTFFKEATTKQFYQDFLHFFQKRATHFHIYSAPALLYADATYLPYYQESYIQINARHELLDIPTIAHEYAHSIQFFHNYNKNLFKELIPFVEIVSTFIELICTEFITEQYYEKIGIITQFEELDTTLENIKSLKDEIRLLKTMSSSNIDSIITDDDNIDIIEESASSYFIYDTAWLIATNLFQIYLNDPEKAFYFLYKIINLDTNLSAKDYFQELTKLGLTTPEGLKTYDNYIKRKLTRL